MSSYTKDCIKIGVKSYAGYTLFKMGSDMRRRNKQQKQQQQQQTQNPPITANDRFEFGVYESTLVRVNGALSSLMETILKNDLDVEPYVMKEAQEIMNGFQGLLDAKQKYQSESRKNGN